MKHVTDQLTNTKGTKRFHGTQNVDDGVYMNILSYVGSMPEDKRMVKRAKTIKDMKEDEIRNGSRTVGGRKTRHRKTKRVRSRKTKRARTRK